MSIIKSKNKRKYNKKKIGGALPLSSAISRPPIDINWKGILNKNDKDIREIKLTKNGIQWKEGSSCLNRIARSIKSKKKSKTGKKYRVIYYKNIKFGAIGLNSIIIIDTSVLNADGSIGKSFKFTNLCSECDNCVSNEEFKKFKYSLRFLHAEALKKKRRFGSRSRAIQKKRSLRKSRPSTFRKRTLPQIPSQRRSPRQFQISDVVNTKISSDIPESYEDHLKDIGTPSSSDINFDTLLGGAISRKTKRTRRSKKSRK